MAALAKGDKLDREEKKVVETLERQNKHEIGVWETESCSLNLRSFLNLC